MLRELHQLLRSGQTEAALAALEARLSASPDDSGLVLLKGVALFQTGAVSESEEAFRHALNLGWHTVTQAWKNLASITYRDNRFDEAVDFIVQYREASPRDKDALALHVSALLKLGRFPVAEDVLRKFLEIYPDDADALADLLSCLGLQGRYLELLAFSGSLTESSWKAPKVVRVIAKALIALGLEQPAWEMIATPVNTEAGAGSERAEVERMFRYQSAERALEEHRFADAVSLYQASIHGSDEMDVALFNLSIALLALGRLGEGWRLMRARASLFPMALVRGVPVWDRESLDGRTLLVHSEQGIGDVIQFIRFLPKLEAIGARVVFNAYPDILRLLSNDPRAKKSVLHRDDFGAIRFDFQAQLLDLPVILGTDTAADIPSEVPYLYANADRLAHWRHRLSSVSGLKIGLVWAGNSKHKNDHHRSARLSDFESLAVLPGITWVLLQKGSGESEGLAPPEGMQVIRASEEIDDFDDTAAIVECLDLVISVDTSVAHLAGALNKPVWILLSDAGKDWRWFLDEEHSPWYPSARLFSRGRDTVWPDFLRDSVRPVLARWVFEHLPSTHDWMTVNEAISHLLGKADGEEDKTEWMTSFSNLGIDPLPFARALSRERNEPQQLATLYESASVDGFVSSAWAEWLLQTGNSAAALSVWRTLAETCENIPPSGFIAWGTFLHEQALYDEAEKAWAIALLAFPFSATLHYMAGRTAQWAGSRERAIACYERALELSPRYAQAHNNLGIVREKDSPLLALASFQNAMLFDCNCVQAWQNAARVMLDKGAAKVVALFMRERCKIHESPGHRIAFARALLDSGDLVGAKDVLRQLDVDNGTQDPNELLDRAFLYGELGESEQSKEALSRLVSTFSMHRSGHLLYGWKLLTDGRYEEGWAQYAAGLDPKQTVVPEWQGENLRGRSLLVYQDQGMGDLFQFLHLVRCVPDDAEVTLAVVDHALELVLFQGLPCKVVALSTIDWQSSRFDFQIAQMKLPHLLHVNLASPLCSPPYIRAPMGLIPQWETVCAADQKTKVGIVWAGNPKYANDARRSTRLRDWLPIFGLPGISFYSLQKDIASNQALAWDDLELYNVAFDCDGWGKTANALMLLDLVISVDTGVAHLAACLGKKTWILLPYRGTDYRWQRDREDVPWYPQARLFRQQSDENWSDVLLRVRNELCNDTRARAHHV